MPDSTSEHQVGPISLVPGGRGSTTVGGLSRCTREQIHEAEPLGTHENLFSSFE